MFPDAIRLLHVVRDPSRSAEAQVRDWLATVTGIAPMDLPLQRDARGRPRLHGALAADDISWSHSGEALLVAFGRGMRLGIDLEARSKPRDVERIARHFFAPDEQDWLLGLPEDQRVAAFLRLWCAKEALLKAHGHGLSFGLDRLAFAPTDNGGLRLVACDPGLGVPDSWSLHLWSPAPGETAALAWQARAVHG